MSSTQHDNVIIRELPMLLTAHWERPLGCTKEDLNSVADGEAKPTMMVWAKRRQKAESFLPLRLIAQLREEGREGGTLSNVTVDKLKGLDVVFSVTNKYDPAKKERALEYSAKLAYVDRDEYSGFEASVKLSETELRDVIFKKDGPLDAKVNENLLDFSVRVLDIPEGKLEAESYNRVLVYRNRLVVFVPGLLGSTIEIKTTSGRVSIYPCIFPKVSEQQEPEVSRFFSAVVLMLPGGLVGWSESLAAKSVYRAIQHRKIEVLECDSEGMPIFETKAELFRLLGALPRGIPGAVKLKKLVECAVVYDIKDVLEGQWDALGRGKNRPEGFSPFILMPWPYDWRLDLEDSAQQLFFELKQLQQNTLIPCDDLDDLVTLSGHSTGGVINRRVCGLNGAGEVIEHSFFMNVPFRGAPKALSAMLFGGDPPLKGRFSEMVPHLITASSMVHIAPNLPIVYYLSPSNYYPDPVFTMPDLSGLPKEVVTKFPNSSPGTRDQEKEYLIQSAIAAGIYYPMRPVPSLQSATFVERAQLAEGATEWHEKWWDCQQRKAYGMYWNQPDLEAFNQRELTANESLVHQDEKRLRSTIGWNKKLAGNAALFCQKAESLIDSSLVELYVFFSEGHKTTGSVDMIVDRETKEMSLVQLTEEAKIIPSYTYGEGNYPKIAIDSKCDFRFPWWVAKRGRKWVQFSAMLVDGDGTVPRASLLGIGTRNATIFRAIPENPKHVPAPNSAWVWARVLDVLTGRSIESFKGEAEDIEPKNIPCVKQDD